MTCKQCEHYEFYDGPNTICGKKVVMLCRGPTNLNCGFFYIDIGNCSSFSPKKPKEPDEKPKPATISPEEYSRQLQREMAAARQQQAQQLTLAQMLARPMIYNPTIPKEPKKKEKTMKTCESCDSYTKHEGNKIDEESGKTAIMCCTENEEYYSDTEPCEDWESAELRKKRIDEIIEQKINKPLIKENKMKIGIFKFSIRRYMVLCTVLVTARIAMWLNPLVYRAWHLMPWEWENVNSFTNHAGPWILTISAILVCYGILLSWNSLSVWVFGEKKS